jgi:hypothetical protein
VQVQLVRIQLRVPEYGWTTQKVFHLLNALVCSLRCGSFLFRAQMEQLHPDALRLVLFDLPGEQQLQAAVAVGVGRYVQQLCCTANLYEGGVVEQQPLGSTEALFSGIATDAFCTSCYRTVHAVVHGWVTGTAAVQGGDMRQLSAMHENTAAHLVCEQLLQRLYACARERLTAGYLMSCCCVWSAAVTVRTCCPARSHR